MLNYADLIIPDWPASPNIKAVISTRNGGVSCGSFASLNLGNHVGDNVAHVAENRRRFCSRLPQPPVWLRQVHGTHVAYAHDAPAMPETGADAAVTDRVGIPCAVMVADCLPVLFCDTAGTVVGAAHAGWRGLCAGVLQNTVAAMQVPPAKIMAYMGPAIGPHAFEVGAEVRAAFMAADAAAAASFSAIGHEKYRADIYKLAKLFLARVGVTALYGGEFCTVEEPGRFFSYRRDQVTGRMAAAVWLDKS